MQIIFHKRATKYRSLLRKMTYKDKGSHESSPPCIRNLYIPNICHKRPMYTNICHERPIHTYKALTQIYVCHKRPMHIRNLYIPVYITRDLHIPVHVTRDLYISIKRLYKYTHVTRDLHISIKRIYRVLLHRSVFFFDVDWSLLIRICHKRPIHIYKALKQTYIALYICIKRLSIPIKRRVMYVHISAVQICIRDRYVYVCISHRYV